jgi:hypothetical protein
MKIEDVARTLARQKLDFALGTEATDREIIGAQNRLDIVFPSKVRLFYQHYNGLTVIDPPLTILPLDQLNYIAARRLCFALLNINQRICFDTSRSNEAGQWSIVDGDSDYVITLTMPSFWSNKIWHWLNHRRPIWRDYHAGTEG